MKPNSHFAFFRIITYVFVH
uniref:Uncharacterized protein n=1 Tax=Anguilla anguilla TaxID=7936 RepID=A0A0E9UK01_ANGAN